MTHVKDNRIVFDLNEINKKVGSLIVYPIYEYSG